MIELTNQNKVIWKEEGKIDIESLQEIVLSYLASTEFQRLQLYDNYYEAENTFITAKVEDKQSRGKTPNNYIPTSYFATIVDTLSGYMFSDIQYNPKGKADTNYAMALNDLLFDNDSDIKDMKTGIRSLAYNKGIELVYTVGDGVGTPAIRYTSLDPRQIILIYDNKIEPDLYAAIRVTIADGKDLYNIDVIYKDEWQYYSMNDKNKLEPRQDPDDLFFFECPVVVYNSNDMSLRSPFHKVIQYINALDFLITGNANDMEKLADAILVLTKLLKEEDLKNLNELKAIMDVSKEDRAEYLVKNTDPAFRKYASELLIREIHKHSHVIDWYSPDNGLSGDISGKALKIRLFDMDMFSRKIEKVFKKGTEKKIRLINTIMAATGQEIGDVDIVFNRVLPDDFDESAPILEKLTFISDETKMERLGLNVENEKQKLEDQKSLNAELFNLNNPIEDEEEVEEEG